MEKVQSMRLLHSNQEVHMAILLTKDDLAGKAKAVQHGGRVMLCEENAELFKAYLTEHGIPYRISSHTLLGKRHYQFMRSGTKAS